MNNEQWIQYSDADGERERAAFSLLRKRLPDYSPFQVWAKFRFLSLSGAYFDVDALVFSEVGVFLVEFAEQRGALDIGPRTWLHTPTHGRVQALDNPLKLARVKADELHKLLERRVQGKYHAPPIQPLVFVSEAELQVTLAPEAANSVFFHPEHAPLPSILDALIEAQGPGVKAMSARLGREVLTRFEDTIEAASIEAIPKLQSLRDFRLGELLDTTRLYQDYQARHRRGGDSVRARIYRVPRGVADDQRERIREAARREYSIVSDLDHPSILAAHRLIDDRRNPSVIFEHPAGAVRLDHYLEQAQNLSASDRFKLLESIAEAVRYAHQNRVIHRALSPQSVLVIPPKGYKPAQIRLYNWHTGLHDEHETGTRHVGDYLHDTSHLFLAPEIGQTAQIDESADIFGLGALAYYLFVGEPPARDLPDYIRTIAEHRGLRLTAVRDAVSAELDELVWSATRAHPRDRLHSVDAFIKDMAHARRSLVAVNAHGIVDPRLAESGTLIADRYKVLRRLGAGSTATAFLVEHDGREYVLKIANDHDHASRLLAEAEALKKFDHPLIVKLIEVFEAGGCTILALQFAGQTFSERLRKSRAISLDDLRRFGTDLCEICTVLEEQRVFHRDIKPANLGIGAPSGSRQLMLFDFSLAGVAIESVAVGTYNYRDPFVRTRHRWDTYADRYSAALVLYEMVTQQLPQWGDGRGDPAADPDATLELIPERFPAAIRDSLREFFEQALAREISDRFDNAAEMARSWSDIFAHTMHSEHESDTLEAKLHQASALTRMSDGLGLSQLALDALDAAAISTVQDLLARPANAMQFAIGISGPVRNEIRELRDKLARLLPSLDYHSTHEPTLREPESFNDKSVDHLLDYITGKRGGSLPADLTELIGQSLFYDNLEHALPWASQHDLARRSELNPTEFDQKFRALNAAWLRKKAVAPLRDDIVRIVADAGGAMTSTELSYSVLGKRGSTRSGQDRTAAASAVTRAGVEAELLADSPRLTIRRRAGETFIATNPALLDMLPSLGELADRFAQKDSLASSKSAFAEVISLFERAHLDLIGKHRALSLAAAASQNAALSRRNEFYPRGMPARRALTLCSNLLPRRAPLSEDALGEVIREHYPHAESLPERSVLIRLLKETNIALEWDPAANNGHGEFVFPHTDATSAAISRSTEASTIFGTSTTFQSEHNPQVERERLEDRLAYKSQNGGFLALTVPPAHALKASPRLAEQYDLSVVSIEALFLRHFRQQAEEIGINWQVLLDAENAEIGGLDHSNFVLLLSRHVLPAVREELLAMRGRILLIQPGLLARWDAIARTMGLVDALRDRLTNDPIDLSDAQATPDVVWLLIAANAQKKRPHIDGVPVPVLNDSEYLRIPSRWISGESREATRTFSLSPG